jgi:predicted dehydrogenase/threonine dehydrogenase-like Zn-dependent dehydrogenase
MKQVLVKSGTIMVAEVPAPLAGPREILVQVAHSCISPGTEIAGLSISALPLYRRALKQPQHVKRVLEMARNNGLKHTLERVRGQLIAGSPTGYSAAGKVVAVGSEVIEFRPGDRVACAGAGIANHAEVINVPVNLAVKVPEGIGTEQACTVTLGSIAMQGVRRAQPTLGEIFVVIGLGILGQITAQLLKIAGCRVLGVDPDPERVRLALENGMDCGLDPTAEDYVDRAHRLSNGFGADAAIVTAASSSDQIISDAMQSCRKKGRVVLVGDVGLNLKRTDFYIKELDFLISSSYGPGRYDPLYEDGGQDYPIAYVRWTENRNMEAYLQLIADGRMHLKSLIREPFEIDRAAEAYDALKRESEKPLVVVLRYPDRSEALDRVVMRRTVESPKNRIRVAVAGAGGFAQGTHLPNLAALRDRYSLRAVMSRTGSNAKAIADQYQAAYSTTEYEAILADPDVDLIIIATRHDLHARLVLDGLRAGKHVFVEKPLSINTQQLDEVEQAASVGKSLLMTGFNRRFAPAIRYATIVLAKRTTPIVVNYRMNAGFVSREHWVHGPEGGGRNIGEACHIYDLFNYLTASRVHSIQAASIDPSGKQWHRNDNFVTTIRYEDGSLCSLTYTALGNRSFPKERMEIFADGKVFSLDDYKLLTISGGKHKGWRSVTSDKGQFQELVALGDALQNGTEWPISLEDQVQATRTSFEIERQISAAFQIRMVAQG